MRSICFGVVFGLWWLSWTCFAHPLWSQDDGSESPELRAQVLVREGLELGKEKPADAAERYQHALALFRAVGDLRGQANCWLFLGVLADRQEEREAARADFEQSLVLLRKLDDPLGISFVLTLLAAEHELLGKHSEALSCSEESLDLLRKILLSGGGIDTTTIAAFSEQTYCPNAATWKLLPSLPPPVQAMMLRVLESLNLQAIARAQRALDLPEAALGSFEQAITAGQPMGIDADKLHRQAAEIARTLGRFATVGKHLEALLELARTAADWKQEALLLEEIVGLEQAQGHVAAAIARCEELLELARTMADDALETTARERLEELRLLPVNAER